MTDTVPIHAVVLAAGASTRFGAGNKLLADVNGEPLVAIVAGRIVSAGLESVIAVVAPGLDGDAVANALRHTPVKVVVNTKAADGMGTSIACGTAAVTDTSAAIMIVPGDMPSLNPALLDQLIAAFRDIGGRKIVYPVTGSGKQRNPVIWPAWLRPELLNLHGTTGGKPLLAAHYDHIVPITIDTDQPFHDIDTQEDLARVRSGRP